MLTQLTKYLVQQEMKILGLAALGFVAYIVLNVLYQWGSHWIESGAVVLLVIVTAIYVERTGRIATHTEKQVEEMTRQRVHSMMPILVVECNNSHTKKKGACGIEIPMQNIGLGPAMDIAITIAESQSAEILAFWESGAGNISLDTIRNIPELAAGDNTGNRDNWIEWYIAENQKFVIVAECSDVYGNSIGACREFVVSDDETTGNIFIKTISTVSAKHIVYRIRRFSEI